jgi:hypothetical protein
VSGPSRFGQFGRVGVWVIAVLFLLTVAAFIYSQRLKREPLVIDRVEFVALGAKAGGVKATVFSPNGDCRRDRMGIYFRTTKTDRADVEIVGRRGGTVRTLASDRFFKRYREHSLIWDGRNELGRVPPSGPYRVRVTMTELDRVLKLPGKIRLHRFPGRDTACDGRDSLREAGGSG